MMRTVVMVFLMILTMQTSVMSSDLKDTYRPLDQEYPQIIQNSDYEAIRAIETLYTEISKLGEYPIFCKANGHSIIFQSARSPQKEVLISIPQKGPVTIGDTPYVDSRTVTLFNTLRKLLIDLSAKHECSGVLGGQFSTRAYNTRTILEFDFEKNIVELDSLSNGPDDEERLYTLDIVSRQESFFFSHSNIESLFGRITSFHIDKCYEYFSAA